MPSCYIVAVMIHVPGPAEGLAWYEKAFPSATRHRLDGQEFEYLQVGDTRLEIVQADEKVSSGPRGTVVYWNVANLSESLLALQNIGARLYRGPMTIENGQSMCQVQDPWGNCLGLRGATA